jgi:acetolactate synthase-1/2/3 large subunit
MKLSDFVIDFVAKQGVKHIFMLPGGGAMHLNDSLQHSTNLTYVSTLHEQASAMAAETYAKVSGNLGVALVTTGPGGTNAITGLAGAWLDSTPCLFISGQAKRSDLKGMSGVRQMGLQEIDIVSVIGPLTKYAVTILDVNTIRYHLEKAVFIARQPRTGPVWIDIPLDVQGATIDPDELPGFDPGSLPHPHEDEDVVAAVAEVIALFNSAERPILLFGNGVRLAGAQTELTMLIEQIGIPVLSTWLSVDMIAYDHALYVGKPGTVAPRGVNFALQNADFLLAIGARLDFTITGYAPDRLAREAKKIMVDIDPAELAKLARYFDLPIRADAGDFLREFLVQKALIRSKDRSPWLVRCREWKSKYPVILPEHRRPDQQTSVYFLSEILSDELADGQLIVSGSSGAGIEIFQHALRLKAGQRLLHTTALGSMGNGVPSAIGAYLAGGGRPTVCIEGDGSIQMNAQEFETIRRLNLPIKVFVLSNNGYSSIRTSQTRWFGRLTGADPSSGLTLPDIVKIAKAYGLPTARICDQRNLRAEVRAVLDTPGPMICEVICIPDEARIPSMSSAQRADGSLFSKPIEDLWPFLDRDEFLSNMIVAPIE